MTARTSPAGARWLRPRVDDAASAALAGQAKLRMPAARVLWQRGYRDAAAVHHFLNPSLTEMHDPFLLAGMEQAVERLRAALLAKEPILLYGDYDVDGTSSLVILTKALQMVGANVRYHVPHRLKEGYGMRADVVQNAAAEGVRLIVSVDTGIRAAEVVRIASTLGIDVIITDHHLPEAELPPAVAVVNPNRPDCRYPTKDLCGAAVAYKLIHALLVRLEWPVAKIQRLMESFLKLVAMATVADVVPLVGENRVIVKRGLEGFRTVNNPGLRALMTVAGIKEGEIPSAGQVAFRLAPRLNAAGRMADAGDVIDLFLTHDPLRAESLAQQLHDLNQERQTTESDIVKAVLDECIRTPVTDEMAALVFSGEGWHRGVIGIVASRLVDRYHRPVFVLGQENGTAQGSGRSIALFHLLEALETMPDLFTKFGGHKMAAGLTIPTDRVPEFRDRLNTFAQGKLTTADFCPTLEIDAHLALPELDDLSAEEVLRLAPFGHGNPAPLFLLENVTVVSEPAVFGEKHLRVRLEQRGRAVQAKAWNFLERRAEIGWGQKLNAVVCVEDDAWSRSRGYSGWGLVIKDVAPA